MAELIGAFGSYGGTVRRKLNLGGKTFMPGDPLTPEDTMSMGVNNRMALADQGKIAFFGPAATRDTTMAARKLGAPLPATPEEVLDPNMGQFGGMVLKELVVGNVRHASGDYLSPRLVMSWPLKNRHAIVAAGKVAYFAEEPEGEMKVKITREERKRANDILS